MNSILNNSSISFNGNRIWPGKFCQWAFSWVLQRQRCKNGSGLELGPLTLHFSLQWPDLVGCSHSKLCESFEDLRCVWLGVEDMLTVTWQGVTGYSLNCGPQYWLWIRSSCGPFKWSQPRLCGLFLGCLGQSTGFLLP